MDTAVDLDEDRAALYQHDLRVAAALDDGERVEDACGVTYHLGQRWFSLNWQQLHPKVDDRCAVVDPLVILPDGHTLVHAVACHRVDHILFALEVLLQEDRVICEPENVLGTLERMEGAADAVGSVDNRDAIRASALDRLDHGAVWRGPPGGDEGLNALNGLGLHLVARLESGRAHSLGLGILVAAEPRLEGAVGWQPEGLGEEIAERDAGLAAHDARSQRDAQSADGCHCLGQLALDVCDHASIRHGHPLGHKAFELVRNGLGPDADDLEAHPMHCLIGHNGPCRDRVDQHERVSA
mmetsp:Transcript_26576/g.85888  ORF Transcript_26576/g.85888 Transcript_26576/m.85888 type:complete len:297 (-) Transcript_26576:394-1284(-)